MKYFLLLLSLSCLFHTELLATSQKFNVKIELSSSIKVDKLLINYDGGIGEKPVDLSDINQGNLDFSDELFAPYASIHINYAEQTLQFFVSEKPANIRLRTTDSGELQALDLENAWTHVDMGEQALLDFLKDAQEDFERFMLKHGEDWMQSDSLIAIARAKADKISDMTGEFVIQHGDLYYAFWMFRKAIVYDPYLSHDSLMSIFHTYFSEEWVKSKEGERILEIIDGRKQKMGRKVPQFETFDVEGSPISPKQFAGKYLIINFWSSSCGPCLAEMPQIIKAKNQYPLDKLDYLFITADTDTSFFKKSIQKHQFAFGHHVFGNRKITEKYAAYELPQVFLVDPKGTIIYDRAAKKDYELNGLLALLEKELIKK